MEGLEISEVKYHSICKNKDNRVDSDFWTKRSLLNKSLRYDKIGNILLSSQYGISIEMNLDKKGYPIYRMNEIHDMLCDIDVEKYADITAIEMELYKLNDRDVLFNRTNSYEFVGRTGLYKQIQENERIFASYLVRFVPDKSIILPEYLVAFLNTSYGIKEIKRRSRQSINQTNVNPEEVKDIDIPILSMEIQEHILFNFNEAHNLVLISNDLYSQAEELLLQELGLKGFVSSNDPVNIVSLKDSFETSGRLDAEYYQKKYEELIKRIKKLNHDNLHNIAYISKSIEPGSEAYSEDDTGIPFLRVSDYDKFSIKECAKKLSNDYYLKNKKLLDSLMPKSGTILLSKDGTVGIAHYLNNDSNFVTSGAVLHLMSNK